MIQYLITLYIFLWLSSMLRLYVPDLKRFRPLVLFVNPLTNFSIQVVSGQVLAVFVISVV